MKKDLTIDDFLELSPFWKMIAVVQILKNPQNEESIEDLYKLLLVYGLIKLINLSDNEN